MLILLFALKIMEKQSVIVGHGVDLGMVGVKSVFTDFTTLPINAFLF